MKTKAVCLKFEKELDLERIKKSVSSLSSAGSDGALYIDVDSLRLFFLKNGIVRLTVPHGDMPSLEAEVAESGTKANAIIRQVASASGQSLPKDLKMDVEDVDGTSVFGHPYDEFRPELKKKADIRIVNSMVISVFDIIGEFEAKRVQAQAGENIGRAMAAELKGELPYEELYGHISRGLWELGLGKIRFEKPRVDARTGFLNATGHVALDIEKRHPPMVHEAVVTEGYLDGLMVSGKPTCDIIRGFLRGTFCQYMGVETVFVDETECWEKGDTKCRFVVSRLGV